MLRRLLLVCGVLSSLLYVATDVLAAIVHPDYHSFTSRAVSELMARGAPTEWLVDPLFLLYDVLLIAFGVGVWRSPGRRRLLRVVAILLIANGATGLTGPTIFEMNVRGTGDGTADLLHIAATAVLGLLIVATIGVGAFLHGRRFRIYSLATILVLLVSGALTAFDARHLAAGEPTRWMGLFERINIGAYLLWVAALAISLFPARNAADPGARRGYSSSSSSPNRTPTLSSTS